MYVMIFCFYVVWFLISGIFKLIWNLISHKGSGFHTTCTTGEEYEVMCCQKLKQHGFTHIETTPKSGDHGIDILAHRAGKKYAIQCKYYSSPVGNHAIQEAYSGCAYYRYDIDSAAIDGIHAIQTEFNSNLEDHYIFTKLTDDTFSIDQIKNH